MFKVWRDWVGGRSFSRWSCEHSGSPLGGGGESTKTRGERRRSGDFNSNPRRRNEGRSDTDKAHGHILDESDLGFPCRKTVSDPACEGQMKSRSGRYDAVPVTCGLAGCFLEEQGPRRRVPPCSHARNDPHAGTSRPQGRLPGLAGQNQSHGPGRTR